MEKELRQLLVTVFLWGTSGFMVAPAITDVTMSALCPAEYQCSLAIYLTGFQQAITGVGAVVTTPLMGNLSDKIYNIFVGRGPQLSCLYDLHASSSNVDAAQPTIHSNQTCSPFRFAPIAVTS
ncbi:uncharacterized protein LOC114753136 [Neltuma alba]|uniref:uncharacterized protein LOC114753136 n=1 Tax=Neltuma alba TaxID=207710 RepID=UPI0010A4D636|nr:uncharacterized protein LOC114753136 [Prosopis alba]